MISHKETVREIEAIQPLDTDQELECFYHYAQVSGPQSHYDTDIVREYLDILKQEAVDNLSDADYAELYG